MHHQDCGYVKNVVQTKQPQLLARAVQLHQTAEAEVAPCSVAAHPDPLNS